MANTVLVTYRLEEEDDYVDKIWIKIFIAYSRKVNVQQSFILSFFNSFGN